MYTPRSLDMALQEANYSHNDIEEVCDLSLHQSLSKLILDRILYTNNNNNSKCVEI